MTHYLLATICVEQGDLESASRSLRTALYLDANFALAHFAQGNLRLETGDVPGAMKCFENVVEIASTAAPDDPVPHGEGITAGRLVETVRRILTQVGGAL